MAERPKIGDCPGGYVSECIIVPRAEESVFTITEEGRIVPTIHQYVIIPIERYGEEIRGLDELECK